MAPRPELLPIVISSAWIVGMVPALLVRLREPLEGRWPASPSANGIVRASWHLLVIGMALLAGMLIDQGWIASVVLAGSLLTAVGLGLLAACRTAVPALGGLLLTGAVAGLGVAGTVLLPAALFPHSPAASLNLGFVFVGLGAIAAPVLTDLLLHKLGFQRGIGLLALVCLLPALATSFVSSEAFALPESSLTSPRPILGHPVFWLIATIFVFYVPLESFVKAWSGTYLTALGFSERGTQLLCLGHGLAFLGSRLLVAFLLERGTLSPQGSTWLLVVLTLLTAAVLGNLAGAPGRSPAAGVGGLLLGLLLGPVLPTLIGGTLLRAFPDSWGFACGALLAVGAFGQMLGAPLLDGSAHRVGVQNALRLPAVLTLVPVAVALVLALS